jgi:hypothetical protein
MTQCTLIWAAATVAAGSTAIYGLHHLCLWLERRGWLFYRDRKPESSPLSCLVGLQRQIEPGIVHVIEQKHNAKTQRALPGEPDDIVTELANCFLGATAVDFEAAKALLARARALGLDDRAIRNDAFEIVGRLRPDRLSSLSEFAEM